MPKTKTLPRYDTSEGEGCFREAKGDYLRFDEVEAMLKEMHRKCFAHRGIAAHLDHDYEKGRAIAEVMKRLGMKVPA
jgi:hypothetical protein